MEKDTIYSRLKRRTIQFITSQHLKESDQPTRVNTNLLRPKYKLIGLIFFILFSLTCHPFKMFETQQIAAD